MITKQQAEQEFGIVDGQIVETLVHVDGQNFVTSESEYTELVLSGYYGKRELNQFNKVGFVPTHKETKALSVVPQGRFDTPNGWRVLTSTPVYTEL